MKRSLLLLASLLTLLVACAAPTASPIPTAFPPEYLPTVIALTAEAANVLGTEVALALTPTVRLPRHSVNLTWHERFSSHPGHTWLRGLVVDVARAAMHREL